jgi:hypothetical protein
MFVYIQLKAQLITQHLLQIHTKNLIGISNATFFLSSKYSNIRNQSNLYNIFNQICCRPKERQKERKKERKKEKQFGKVPCSALLYFLLASCWLFDFLALGP